MSSRFLTELFGSGVQHIALATGDIFATVEHLKANGVELLPIPENYYDDLEARTDLSPKISNGFGQATSFTTAMGKRSTFKPIPRHMEGGFFFEIVERRDYQGYGATNAPIRLASQSRLAPDVPPGSDENPVEINRRSAHILLLASGRGLSVECWRMDECRRL